MPLVIQEIPKAQLVIIGFGPQKDQLQKQIQTLNLSSSVFLIGGKTGKELRWKLDLWKRFLRNTESFGVVVRDPKRVVNDKVALELLQEQDYKCKVCECEITSDTMRKGHTDAWADGNPTTKVNTVMLCDSCNRDMEDMSYEEYMKTKVTESV